MAGFSFGLGPQDWLKMANPLKTVAPIQNTGTTQTKPIVAAGSTTAPTPKPTPSPLPTISSNPGATTTPNPLGMGPQTSTGTWGNLLPSAPTASTAPATPKTDPVSGLPVQPAGTQPTQMNVAPTPLPTLNTVEAPKTTMQPAAQPITGGSAPAVGPDGLTDAERADKARAAGAAASAASSLQANTAVGQQQQSTQANAMANASQTAAQGASAPTPPAAGTPATTTQLPAAQPVTAAPKTEPSLDDNLANYEKIAQDWANGVVDDKAFRTAANTAILQMGAKNSADMDALKMRINSDPSLAGQGAGSAMLSMMAANQNFNADQLFGQLAESAQQKILDMQKYGLEEGVRINQQRRDNAYKSIAALQDAGDFTGAAKLLAKTVDFPGVSIDPTQFSASRSRQTADIQNLMSAGNYQGAAEKLSALTGKTVNAQDLQQRDPFMLTRAADLESKGDFDGAAKLYASMGINVTADDLRAQSPFMQTTWSNTLDSIKATATTNPAAAEAELAILMKNPAAAKYLGFSASMNPHDLIQSIVSGQYAADQNKIAGLNTEINRQAKSNVSFAQALENYKQQGPVAWEGLTNTGKQMAAGDLDSFNKARAELGMGPVHKDASGNVVDANGTLLTQDDFAETAAAADYASRKDQINTQPWQAVYDQLMAPNSPFRSQILSIPGGDTMVKQALMTQYLGGTYKTDPATGAMVPDFTNGMPWENPSTSYLFHDWPTALFNDDGTVNGKYDIGGDAYGEATASGQTLQKLPADEQLDNAYAKYRYTGGTMTSTQWYFATAGGTKPPDATKVPTDLQQGENFQNVGTTSSTTTNTTPAPQPGTGAALVSAQAKVDDIIGQLPAKVDPNFVKSTLEQVAKGTFDDWDIRNKLARFPGAQAAGVYDQSDLRHINDKPSQEARDFLAYNNLVEAGVPSKDAADLVIQTIGSDRFSAAYKMLTGKDWTS